MAATKRTSTPLTATTAGALMALALMAAMAATALPFSGSPVINYGQRFYIYSLAWSSYCKADSNNGFRCDVGQPTTSGATKFFIGSGCGPIPSSALIGATLQIDDPIAPFYCYMFPPNVTATMNVWCSLIDNRGPMFQFSNVNATVDGWLHGGVTTVRIRTWLNGANGWCSAQPSSAGAYVQCNRAAVSTWETFYFVPA